MTSDNPVVADILETSAAGYAAAANALLQSAHGDWSGSEWKAHLTQRILELATAVRVNDPALFARRVRWLRRAIRARGADETMLRAAIESLKSALDRELPDDFKSAVRQPLKLALDALDAEGDGDADLLDAGTPLGKLGLEYLTACLELRTDAARTLVLEALDAGLDPRAAYLEVLLPAQREIGQLWHLGEVSVGEERLVSETTRELMTLIVNRHAPPRNPEKTVLLASVSGNAHDIGLRAASHLFRLDGWSAVFLGADMPTSEIARAARSFRVRLVVLSATLATQLGALADAIEAIHQIPDAPRVLVGGLALQESPEAWRKLGADSHAPDLGSAIRVAAALIESTD